MGLPVTDDRKPGTVLVKSKTAVLSGGNNRWPAKRCLRGDELVLDGSVVMVNVSSNELICAFVSQALNLT